MKRTISLLSILAFALAFSSNAFAQEAVEASAEVLTEVSYTAEAALHFGNFTTSFNSATIDPEGTGGDSNNLSGTAGTDYTAGRYQITGSGNQEVTVTLDNTSIALTNTTDGASNDELSLSTSLSQTSGTETTDRGGTAFTSGNNITLDSGTATIWIGGDLTADDDGDGSIDPGTYENTSDLTLTIDYAL